MKKLLILSILLFSIHSQGQTYVKFNGATALLLIPNVGIETSIGKKTTYQFDVLASFWKKVNGVPYEFYTFTNEFRYHFHEKYNGLYVGANAGFDIYNIQKWNYSNIGIYQVGSGYTIGATLGYHKKLNDKFLLDFFVGGGFHQGFYHSYYIATDDRYEGDKAVKQNKSGEFIPYRGGVMISYRFN
jgi:hypothetical protein